MKTCTCDLCKKTMDQKCEHGVEFNITGVGLIDLCVKCTKIVRRAVCKICNGTGQKQDAEYRTVNCYECR